MDNHDKRELGLPNSETLIRWWQETEEQIKLAHPHESKSTQEQLIKRQVQSLIEKYQEKQGMLQPSNMRIAEWYHEELIRLRKEKSTLPLKERRKLAAKIVRKKMNQYRQTIRLDEFF